MSETANLQGPSSTVLRPVVFGIRELGHEWRALLEACGVDPALVDDPEACIPVEQFQAFWPRAAAHTGDPGFGLHVGERLRPMAVNLASYLLFSAATLRRGLERICRYQRVVFAADWLGLDERGPSAAIRLELTEGEPSRGAVLTEYGATLVLRLLDWLTSEDFRAEEVHFRHAATSDPAEYERALHCPVKFSCERSEIIVAAASLDQPSLSANPEIAQLHIDLARRHLAELGEAGLARQVKHILMSELTHLDCTIAVVARRLHMSARTLQRRLAQEGTSYQGLLDALRREVCLHHLAQPRVALCEIAHLAGFSGTPALTRAVRRWTGQTPLEYRRAHARREGDP